MLYIVTKYKYSPMIHYKTDSNDISQLNATFVFTEICCILHCKSPYSGCACPSPSPGQVDAPIEVCGSVMHRCSQQRESWDVNSP